jgi:DNA invertase Pin-like site-specific DNA recombinase
VIAYICHYEGKDALSPEAQLEYIQVFAHRHHLEIVEIIKDTQHVADLKQTSGLKRALERCQTNAELGFIIARLDCLTRSLRMLRALISGVLRRVTLFSVEEELDTRTRAGRSVLGVLESISQWESDIKQIEQGTQRAQHPSLEVAPDWWNIYGHFEGRLFRPEPSSLSLKSRDPDSVDVG